VKVRLYLKSSSLIIALAIIIGLLGFVYYERNDPVKNGQRTDLAMIENLLQSTEETASYQLMPDSIMTGLCWQTDAGTKAGIFKDVNAGLAHWRDKKPEVTEHSPSMKSTPVVDEGYTNLSRILQELSFEATDYSLTGSNAQLTGRLTIANRSREVMLDIDLSDTDSQTSQYRLATLNAYSEIDLEGLSGRQSDSFGKTVNLCLMMQIARNADDLIRTAEKPLQLSQFY
jgi:hypothetical protein